MKLKKLPANKALIQIEKTEKTKTGVYIPDDTHISEVALVLQVGEDVTQFRAGDRILFKSWAPSYYKIGDDEFAILDEEHYDGVL